MFTIIKIGIKNMSTNPLHNKDPVLPTTPQLYQDNSAPNVKKKKKEENASNATLIALAETLISMENQILSLESKKQELNNAASKALSANSIKKCQDTKDDMKKIDEETKKAKKWGIFAQVCKYVAIAASVVIAGVTAGAGSAISIGIITAVCASPALNDALNAIPGFKNASPTIKAIVKTAVVVVVCVASGSAAGAIDNGIAKLSSKGAEEAVTVIADAASTATPAITGEAAGSFTEIFDVGMEDGVAEGSSTASNAAKAGAKSYKFATAANTTQTLAALNPTGDALQAIIKAGGGSDDDSKNYAELISLIINLVVVITSAILTGGAGAGGMLSNSIKGISNAASGTLVASSAAQGTFGILQGTHNLKIANLNEDLGNTQADQRNLKAASEILNALISSNSDNRLKLLKSFGTLNQGFKAYTLVGKTLAQALR
jgi:hypothetical protein